MSLRARLVLTLLLLAAVGLLVLAAVTYATQRHFQEDQLDQRVRAQQAPIGRRLEVQSGRVQFPGNTDFGRPAGAGGAGGPGGSDLFGRFDAAEGSYGQLRDRGGKVLYPTATSTKDAPKLPAKLHVGQMLTVEGTTGGSYRVGVYSALPPDPRQGAAGGAPDAAGAPKLTATSGDIVVVALPRQQVTDTLHRLLLVEALVIVGVLVLLGALTFLLVRAGLRPLERMGATAGAIAAGDLSRRVEEDSPRTEVGRLGQALNGMLGRLELAFAERAASEGRLRQFLSDASHELRTPLSSIRGYAELYRMGVARSGEDVEKAMSRIEDEAARMGVLVEDLLVLARLDEVRDTVPEEVDLAALADDAVADAGAQAPTRQITATAGAGALVLGDADQLRQVLANLVRNALVHTPPDAAIEVGAHRDGDQAVLTVRDHGHGLPPGDPQALFGRFWRSQGKGRERGKAGAGLGLAIVAGIVAAHGGTVSAADAAGGGAEFTVRLPALPLPAHSQARPSGRSRGVHQPSPS